MAFDAFIHKIEQALEALVTLQVVTAVGTPRLETAEGTPGKLVGLDGKAKSIWTTIDLVQGDITTVIHPELEGESGRELRAFHQAREAQGLEIIRTNIAALRELVLVLDEVYERQRKRPTSWTETSGPG